MPVKIGTLFSNLGKKAGLDMSDAKYADILAIATEIPDDAATALEQKLIPLDTAHTNGKVRGIIQSEILDGIDAELNGSFDELEFDDATKSELKAIKKTADRLKTASKKIKELEAKKASATKDTDKNALQSRIDELNGKLSTEKAAYDKQLADLSASHETALLDRDIEVTLATGYKYANKDLSMEDNVFLANKKLRDELSAKGWTVKRDPQNPKTLIVVDKDGIPATDENHNKVLFKNLTDGVLANAKLLAVNDPEKDKKDGDGNLIIPGGGEAAGNKDLVTEYDAIIEKA